MAIKLRPQYPERLTKAGKALAEKLEEPGVPIVTPHEIFHAIRAVYAGDQRLYLRSQTPEIKDYRRLRRNLMQANILAPDADYRRSAYRVLKVSDLPADDICCLVDPFSYISHLSAMQRYGLTDRRPEALHLSRPAHRILREMIKKKMDDDYKAELSTPSTKIVPLTVVTHPRRVRGRKIHLLQTLHSGRSITIRGSFARIASIGQTFIDTVEEPSLCGGMNHVLDVWHEHAKTYLEDIIKAVEPCASSIVKVRVGYILDEALGIKDQRIEKWSRFAQRGGSRLLDPAKAYAPTYSERWMISINA